MSYIAQQGKFYMVGITHNNKTDILLVTTDRMRALSYHLLVSSIVGDGGDTLAPEGL